MRTGCGQVCRRDQVVARAGEQVESLFAYRLGVFQHIRDLGAAAFLHAAAGLVLQRGNAAGFIAGAWVFIDHLAVADKIIFEAVDHPHRLVEDFPVLAAGKQNVFRAEHLRYLCQNGAAAQCHQPVGKSSDRRIGRDAGESVGAAALHADHKFRGRDLFPTELSGIGSQLLQQFSTGFQLVLCLLADQELDPSVIPLSQLSLELLLRQILTAQAQHQHASRIGVAYQRCQQLSGLGMVLSHLAAAEWVGKRVQSVDASGDQMLVLLHQRGCDAVDTAHGGDDPEFVAHGGTPVFAAVTLKGSGL